MAPVTFLTIFARHARTTSSKYLVLNGFSSGPGLANPEFNPAARGVTLTDMAQALGVSPTYLSALETGKRGRPTWAMVQRIIAYFNVIWDEAEDLQRLAEVSHPRVVVDTAGLTPEATELANLLAKEIGLGTKGRGGGRKRRKP